MDELNEFEALNECVKIYIPSTTETNQEALELQVKKVDEALELFGDLFGGATANDATGSWLSQETGLVKEKVVLVESFAGVGEIQKKISEVLAFCKDLKASMSQESIALEVNRQMYFV